MTFTRLHALCFSLAALGSLGCGSVVHVTTEAGGTGGSGGSGASGGAGGTGGAGAGGAGAGGGTCSKEELATAYEEPPTLGLQPPPGNPLPALVQSVTPTSLGFTLGPDGSLGQFTWRGPPLTEIFKQGDMVSVGINGGWHYVAGERVAATYTDYQFAPPDVLPPVPMTKSPPLGFVTQCSFPEAGGACDQPAADVRVLAVNAGTGSDAADVAVGATLTVGSFTIHNAQSVALPGYGSDDCVLEALFMTGVTVLAPIAK